MQNLNPFGFDISYSITVRPIRKLVLSCLTSTTSLQVGLYTSYPSGV